MLTLDYHLVGHRNADKMFHNAVDMIGERTDVTKKQGWIHGYPSRVGVGRGCILSHSITWAGSVEPKTAKTLKKVKCDGPMDRRTNGPTKRSVVYTPLLI